MSCDNKHGDPLAGIKEDHTWRTREGIHTRHVPRYVESDITWLIAEVERLRAEVTAWYTLWADHVGAVVTAEIVCDKPGYNCKVTLDD